MPTPDPWMPTFATGCYLSNLRTKIDFRVFQDLMKLAQRHQKTTVFVEKAVDVMLAVDLVVMAERDGFDDAY